MHWDAVLRPVGPLPAAAYWLRRAIFLGLPLVVLIAVVVVVGRHGGAKPSAARKADTPVAGSTASAGSPASASAGLAGGVAGGGTGGIAGGVAGGGTAPGADGLCPDAALSLSLKTRAASYPAGAPPQFVVTVTNTSRTSCRRDVGVGARSITVTSGADRIWSSADCAGGKPDIRTLLPGQVITLGSAWRRERSAPGCSKVSPAGTLALAGSYVGTAMLGTLGPSAGAEFTLS